MWPLKNRHSASKKSFQWTFTPETGAVTEPEHNPNAVDIRGVTYVPVCSLRYPFCKGNVAETRAYCHPGWFSLV